MPVKRFIVGKRFFVILDTTKHTLDISMKDEYSAKLAGLDKYYLGVRVLENVKKYNNYSANKKTKSNYPGIENVAVLDIEVGKKHIVLSKDGIQIV
jgi:hypothetical protein